MSEFLLELYSEEIPPQLQISARQELKKLIENSLHEESLKYKSISSYSSPTRLVISIKDIPDKIKIPSKEIKGPKVGVFEDILNSFMRAHKASKKDIFEKKMKKESFILSKLNLKKYSLKIY